MKHTQAFLILPLFNDDTCTPGLLHPSAHARLVKTAEQHIGILT